MHLRLLASLILPIHVFHSSACFAASSELAQHVIPFLLDKESSTISETKVCTPPLPIASPLLIDEHPSPQLDALETLSLCAQSYGSLTISRYVEDIWPALRTEVLSTSYCPRVWRARVCVYEAKLNRLSHLFSQVLTSKEARVVDQALKTVSDLTKVLASDVVTITSGARVSSNLRVLALLPPSSLAFDANTDPALAPQEFLEPLINQCLHELRSPDSKIAISCGKILQAAASASGTLETIAPPPGHLSKRDLSRTLLLTICTPSSCMCRDSEGHVPDPAAPVLAGAASFAPPVIARPRPQLCHCKQPIQRYTMSSQIDPVAANLTQLLLNSQSSRRRITHCDPGGISSSPPSPAPLYSSPPRLMLFRASQILIWSLSILPRLPRACSARPSSRSRPSPDFVTSFWLTCSMPARLHNLSSRSCIDAASGSAVAHTLSPPD